MDRTAALKIRDEFANVVVARNIVARYLDKVSMEHDSPEALAKYLKEHPNADKANHTVKKPEKEEKGKDEGESKGDKGKGDEGGKDEGSKGLDDIKTSMTWGVMPPKKDFEKYVREAIDPETDEPYWPEGKRFNMDLKGKAEKAICDHLDIDRTGFDEPEELYEAAKKIAEFAEHDDDWYVEELGIDEDEVEQYRDEAMSLATDLMQLSGFEWI